MVLLFMDSQKGVSFSLMVTHLVLWEHSLIIFFLICVVIQHGKFQGKCTGTRETLATSRVQGRCRCWWWFVGL